MLSSTAKMVNKGGLPSTSASIPYTIPDPEPPLTLKELDAMKEYAESLEDLFINSKPLINMLTMLAEENRASARAIVLAIEHHLRKVPNEVKLPVLYLIDSIYKNVGSPYNTLFNQNIVPMFCSVFEKGDEKTRMQLFKLRQTWNQMLPMPKLYALDVHVNHLDPAWPVQPPQSTAQSQSTIHINPKFLPPLVQGSTSNSATTSPTTSPTIATPAPLPAPTTATNAAEDAAALRETLRRRQKKLLELRQKKLELELMQTKEKLREQEMLQQQQLIQHQLIAANTTADQQQQKKSKRSSSKHSSSSGSSSSSSRSKSPSSSTELEKQRTRLSQQLKQELAQARLETLKTASIPQLPTSVPVIAATTAAAKVTPTPSIDVIHHSTSPQTSTTSKSSPAAQPSVAIQPAATAAPPVMRIAPVSSQLISAVQKRGAIRDPRLLRASHTSDSTKTNSESSSSGKTTSETLSAVKSTSEISSAVKVISDLLSAAKTTNETLSAGKTTSETLSAGNTTIVTSPSVTISSAKNDTITSSTKPSSVTSSDKNSMSSTDKNSMTTSTKNSSVSSPAKSSTTSLSKNSTSSKSSSGAKTGTSPPSSSKSSQSKSSSSATKSSSSKNSGSGDEVKKSRTSGGGSSQSQSSSVPCSVATADVKSTSSRSSKSSRSTAETAVSKHHHHKHHHQEKIIDTVKEKDSLDLDAKEPSDQSQPAAELTPPPTAQENRIGQLPEQAPPTSTAKRLSEERDVPPPTKKSKVMDRFDELFGDPSSGNRDLNEVPPPPPPPSITAAELKSAVKKTADLQTPLAANDDTSRASGGGKWSKYKTSTPEPYSRQKSRDKDNKDTDRLGRPLLYKHGKDRRNSIRGGAVLEHLSEQEQDDSGGAGEGAETPPRLEGVGGGCSYILQQAEDQFKNGSLSSTQYNQILKEMIELNELKKLDEARRKEEREHRRSRRKYRHHQKESDQSEDTVQPGQPITEQNKEPASESQKSDDHPVNGDYSSPNNMDISPDEDSQSKEREKSKPEDTNSVYEPLQPPPMPPAFVSRRSSEEEEPTKHEIEKKEEVKDVDIRNKEEMRISVEDGGEKKEVVLPSKDVDNRLGFPIARLATPVDTSAANIIGAKEPQFPAVINSTKDIDLRILQRPLVIAPPTPMETEVVESTVPVKRPEVKPPAGAAPPALPPAGAWGGPQPGWMMQGPLPVPWGGPMPPAMHPSNVMPLRPPPIPPQAMFEPESNVRLCRPPLGPLPRPPGIAGPPACPELPAADLGVLESIADDTMKSIEIDGIPRDIRYYADTAVVFLAWDDPREILFQSNTPRKLIIDDRLTVMLSFNAPFPTEVLIDGQTYPVKIGGPTRELYVGNQFYQILFGGPPISVPLGPGDRLHKLQLEGPPPQVRIGRPRLDFCLGKITLIVDARHHYTLYLDPKPQRFDLDGVPHIIRFVEALETAVINGVPFKFEYGGLPRPVYSRGKKHYVRLTSLPHGVVPGFVSIRGMEGGRRSSLPPAGGGPPPRGDLPPGSMRSGGRLPPHLMADPNSQGSDGGGHRTPPNGGSPRQDFLNDERSMPMMDSEAAMMEAPPNSQFRKHLSPVKGNPLDMLSTLLTPAANAPVSGFSYSLEKESTSSSSYQPALSTDQHASKPKPPAPTTGGGNLLGDLNIQQLFEKLVATGIVPTNKSPAGGSVTSSSANQSADSPRADQSEADDDHSHIDTSHASDKIEFVDFGKPQTLRVRQPGLIKQLYTGIQCSSCGVRFAPEQTIKYSQHLDWHFRQNRRERDSARMVHSRTWYYDLSDWTQFEEIEDIEERALSWFDTQTLEDGEGGALDADGGLEEAGGDVPSAACESGAVDVRCALCRDKFDIFYNEDKEEWHLKRAVKQENDYYHPLCWDDHLASMKTPPPEPEEPEKQPEPIASITIEDDSVEKKEEEDNKEDVKKEEEEEDDDDDVIIQEPEHKMEIIELLKDDDEEEEEEERNRLKKEEEEGDESCSKLSSDKKDSEDGDSLKPSDFHSILRNIKKEKIDVDALTDTEQEVIDLDSTRKEVEEGGDLEDDEMPLINQPPPVVDTTQVKVACSIDGNVELVDSGAAANPAPSKIKINISKVITAPTPAAVPDLPAVPSPPAVIEVEETTPTPVAVFRSTAAPATSCLLPPQASSCLVVPLVAPATAVALSQPPPPGEEPVPLNVKPRLIGHKLNDLPPVTRGTELSGLCSIM